MSERIDRTIRSRPLFVPLFVLVLNVALLVLDRSVRYRFRPLDQPTQSRNDPFLVGFSNSIQFEINGLEQKHDIADPGLNPMRSPGQSRSFDSCLSNFVFHGLRPAAAESIRRLVVSTARVHAILDRSATSRLDLMTHLTRSQVDSRQAVRGGR